MRSLLPYCTGICPGSVGGGVGGGGRWQLCCFLLGCVSMKSNEMGPL